MNILDEYRDWPVAPLLVGSFKNQHGVTLNGFFTRDKSGNYQYHTQLSAGTVTPRTGQFLTIEPLMPLSDAEKARQRNKQRAKGHELSQIRLETIENMSQEERQHVHNANIRTLNALVGSLQLGRVNKEEIEQLKKIGAMLEATKLEENK